MINVCSMYLYLFLFIWKWRSIYSVWVNMCHLKWNFLLHFLRDLSNKLSYFCHWKWKQDFFCFFLSYVLMGHFFKLIPVLVEYNSIMFLYNPKKRVFIQMCYLMKSPHFIQDCILDVSFINYDVNVIYELWLCIFQFVKDQ
jgi:hypothetical protein